MAAGTEFPSSAGTRMGSQCVPFDPCLLWWRVLRGGVTAFHSLYRRSFVYTRRLWAGSCPLYPTMSVIVKFEFQSWFKDGGMFIPHRMRYVLPCLQKLISSCACGKGPRDLSESFPFIFPSEATGDVTRLTEGSPTRYVLSSVLAILVTAFWNVR